MSTKVSSNRLLNDRVHRLYLHYLFPTLIAMASNSLYCLADVFFISKGAGSTGFSGIEYRYAIVYTIFCYRLNIWSWGSYDHVHCGRNRTYARKKSGIYLQCVGHECNRIVHCGFWDDICSTFCLHVRKQSRAFATCYGIYASNQCLCHVFCH